MLQSDISQFIGYQILEFSTAVQEALEQIAERLIPHEEAILNSWIKHQYDAWQPPELSEQELREAFGEILHIILHGMHKRQPKHCIADLERAAAKLADRAFPFEALIISIHFLEQSYLPYLLEETPQQLLDWLIGMDEFMHSVLSSVATAYFAVYKRDLLDQAEIGRLVQDCLLADIPGITEDLEVGHIYASARERARLGGDFLDSFITATGSAAFIVGDLSGHGLPAVADALMIRSLFKGFMLEKMCLGDAMTRLNGVLSFQLAADHFATAIALTYEPPGHLNLVIAGHPPPIFCTDECRLFEPHELALGVSNSTVYHVNPAEIKQGELVVIYTDGLIEARHGQEIYGIERVAEEIEAKRHAPSRAIAEHLLNSALLFAGGHLTDDVAILVLKRLG